MSRGVPLFREEMRRSLLRSAPCLQATIILMNVGILIIAFVKTVNFGEVQMLSSYSEALKLRVPSPPSKLQHLFRITNNPSYHYTNKRISSNTLLHHLNPFRHVSPWQEMARTSWYVGRVGRRSEDSY